eukprot:COSAG04_NODE_11452_length_708_cov_1.080460_2_plen_50_part_01
MLYAPHDLYFIRSIRTLASHWPAIGRAKTAQTASGFLRLGRCPSQVWNYR